MAGRFCFDDVPVIETTGGKLKGYFYEDAYIYKGIPYAYADRFQMPVETSWEGIKEATSYGFVCPLLGQDTPSAELMVPHRYWPQDEHCQTLNIWTKTLDKEAKMPVLLWLHGGAYSAGSSNEQTAYEGYNMCMDGDVVVVSVNHRLNILGYLDLSPFGEKYRNSGNAGHADIVAALKWIQKNIAGFGGDPSNVTIFGQSGGGMKVADLIQIPEADGLFQKGMIMSGVGDASTLPTARGNGREIVSALLEELGFGEEVERLETVPYYELARAYEKVSMPVAMNGGYIGGAPLLNEYYMGSPLEYGFREHAYDIPLMIGSVFGEFSFQPETFDKTQLSETEAKEIVRQVYKEHTDEMIEEFIRAYPGKCTTDLLNVDRAFRPASKRLARLHAKESKKTYLYEFALEFPIFHQKIAWHCSDIPFFFNNTDKVEVCGIPGVSDELEKKMFGALIAFAKTGNPGCEGLPAWDAVTEEEEPTMIFDRNCEVRDNFDDRLYEKMDSILPPFNLREMLMTTEVQH